MGTGGVSATAPPSKSYRLFGLAAVSDLTLPVPVIDDNPVVEIKTAPLIATGDRVWHDDSPVTFDCLRDGAAVYLVWSSARFRVAVDRVVVDAVRQADAIDLLVPAVWSVVLALRGQQALHGCAVERDGRALAVLGASGSGKSTAALALLDRGWRLVTDDLLAVDANGHAIPGPPFVRIVRSRAAGRSTPRNSGGKHSVPVVTCPEPAPLAALVVLEGGFGPCRRLSGTAAVAALLGQAYSPLPLDPTRPRQLFGLAADLANHVPVYGAAPRSLDPDRLERIAEEATT